MINHLQISNKGSYIRSTILPNLVTTIALVVICIVPMLDRELPQVVRLGIFFIWVITAFSNNPIRHGSLGWGVLVGWTLYLILQLIYSIVGYSRETSYFLARCYIYVIPIVMVYVLQLYNRKELKVLWYSILIVFVVCLVHNYFLGASGEDEIFNVSSEDKGTNIGGTAFVTGCMFIIPTLWFQFKNGRRYFYKLISVSILVGSVVYMLFWNSRTTILVVFFVLVAGLVLAERSKKTHMTSKRMIIWMVIILGLLVLLAGPVLTKLSGYFVNNVRMSDRIDDLTFVANGGEISTIGRGSLYYRYLLWQTSIQTFFDSTVHFLFGVGEKKVAGDLQSLISSGVGNHSEYFDLAARYGILGIVIYFNMMRKTIKYIMKLTYNESVKKLIVVVLSCMIIYSFFNSLTRQPCAMIMLFLFLPITIQLYKYNKL